MTVNAHNFVADKLVDIVEDKHRRMQLMVNSFTVFGLVFLVLLWLNSLVDGSNPLLSTILGVFSLAATFNVFLMNYNREAGRIGLTVINYSLAVLLLYSGGYESTGMLWSYLLAAVGIFINSFRVGLVLNSLFLGVTSAVLLVGYDYGFSLVEYSDVLSFRVILTLIALSGMCHILIFFQSRADQQILNMHEGGIASLAYLDSLTMLSNRITFRSVLYHTVQLGTKQKSALIYIDLDNFKSINDTYGHDFGDQVLAEYARELKKTAQNAIGKDNVEDYDVGRLGGDEFAIFVRDASDKPTVEMVAERILDITRNETLKSLKNIPNQLGSSIGVAFIDPNQLDLTEGLSIADKAMYQAKNAGKDTIRYISDPHPHIQSLRSVNQ